MSSPYRIKVEFRMNVDGDLQTQVLEDENGAEIRTGGHDRADFAAKTAYSALSAVPGIKDLKVTVEWRGAGSKEWIACRQTDENGALVESPAPALT